MSPLSSIRKREVEHRSRSGPRLHPNPAAVTLNDPLAYGEADASSRVLRSRVQALEDHENLLGVLRVDSDAVISHRKTPFRTSPLGRDMDSRRLSPAELNSIPDQVLKQQAKLRLITHYAGQRIVRDDCLRFSGCRLQVRQGFFECGLDFGRIEFLAPRSDAGVTQKIVHQGLHAARAIHRKSDKLVGIGIEPAMIALRQKLRKARHGPQGLLQIVGSGIGELLEVGIGPGKVGGVMSKLLLCTLTL